MNTMLFSSVPMFNFAPTQAVLSQFHHYKNIRLVVGFSLLPCTLVLSKWHVAERARHSSEYFWGNKTKPNLLTGNTSTLRSSCSCEDLNWFCSFYLLFLMKTRIYINVVFLPIQDNLDHLSNIIFQNCYKSAGYHIISAQHYNVNNYVCCCYKNLNDRAPNTVSQ